MAAGVPHACADEIRRPEPGKKIHVYIFAGQSNMEGRADGLALSDADRARLEAVRDRVQLTYNVGPVQPLDVVDAPDEIAAIYHVERIYGPELFCGISLAETSPDERFMIIKYAVGGTSLYGAWNPDWTAEKAAFAGDTDEPALYPELLKAVNETLAELSPADYVIDAMFWVQGESDGKSIAARESYGANLRTLIERIRGDLRIRELPFILLDVGKDEVVAGMKRTAGEMNNVTLVTHSADPEAPDYLPTLENGHFNNEGQKRIGERFAAVYREHYAPIRTAGTWTEVAPMHEARQYPGLARLPDGRILAVTGHPIGGHSLDSAEIYDPATDSWTETGSLHLARNGVQPGGLIPLLDGTFLLAGCGTGNRSANEAEYYDPVSGGWTETGSMNAPRSNHSSTLLKDGRVLVVGGIDWSTSEVHATAETYDSATGTWTFAGPPMTGRVGPDAVVLKDGRVLIMGGTHASDVAGELASAEIFDPATNTFAPTAPMHVARRAFRAVLLQDGRVMVVGGQLKGASENGDQLDSVELYHPVSQSWAVAESLAEGRWGPDVIVLRDGRVLVSGGMYGRANRRDSAEIYDPRTGHWTSAGSMHDPRNGHRSVALDDDRILVVGGYVGGMELKSCEIYAE